MEIEHISSLKAFIGLVLKFRDSWSQNDTGGEGLWFRGVKRMSHALLPGAYWRKQCDEESIFLSFKAAAPSYVIYRPGNDWDWYVLGQHYGLPTRLLDWTESPLIAFYFALTEEGGKCITPDSTDPPGVWIIDPVNLNKATQGSDNACLFIPDEKRLKYWLPAQCGRGKQVQALPEHLDLIDNSSPVAIFPFRDNPRLVAQRGVFTVHGINELPIDEVYRVNKSTDGSKITKILIDPDACSRLLRDLRTMGINQTMLFPEPSSVASDVKCLYGVE